MLERVIFPHFGRILVPSSLLFDATCAADNHLQFTTVVPSGDCVWSLESKLLWTLQWAPVPHPQEAGWALSHCPCPAPHTPKLTGLRKQWNNEQPRHPAPPRESCPKPAGEHTSTLTGFSKFTPFFCWKLQGALKYFEVFPLSKNSTKFWIVKNHWLWPGQPLQPLDLSSQNKERFFFSPRFLWAKSHL